MNRQPSTNTRAWAMHCVLALATCLWLSYAHATGTSFVATVFGAAFITLSGGVVTVVRARGVFRKCLEWATREKESAAVRVAELRQIIRVLPALHVAFANVQPHFVFDRATGQPNKHYGMHHFATWLWWAMNNPDVNIADWAMRRRDDDGLLPELEGIYGHIEDPKQREMMEQRVNTQVSMVLSEARVFYETDPRSDGRSAQSHGATTTSRHRTAPQWSKDGAGVARGRRRTAA